MTISQKYFQKNAGIGDDLFEAFFADDEPEKKKPAPVAIEVTSAAPEPPKPAVKKTATKKTAVKKTPTKKTPQAPAKESTETAEKEKPQFQHTPALLELAQHTAADKEQAEKAGESESTEKGSESTEKV